jgi:hypothetical protein
MKHYLKQQLEGAAKNDFYFLPIRLTADPKDRNYLNQPFFPLNHLFSQSYEKCTECSYGKNGISFFVLVLK